MVRKVLNASIGIFIELAAIAVAMLVCLGISWLFTHL